MHVPYISWWLLYFLLKNAQFIFTSVIRFRAFFILFHNLDIFVSKLVSFEGPSFAICTSMSSRVMNIIFHYISICLFTEYSLQCSLDLFFTSVVRLSILFSPIGRGNLCVKFSVIFVDTKKYRSTVCLSWQPNWLWLNLLLNIQCKICAASELQTLLLRCNIAILCIDRKNLDRVLLDQVSPTHLLHQQQPEARRWSQWSGN